MNKCLLFFIATFVSQTYQEEIKFVFEMFRHGARAPFRGIVDGKDVYGYPWPGESELSAVGRRMHFLLGTKIRKKYIEEHKFLSPNFKNGEILVMSTDVNRTLESVYSHLQGVYPPGTGPVLDPTQIKNSHIKNPTYQKLIEEEEKLLGNNSLPNQMQLIPVHAFYLKDHTFQLHDRNNCPGLKENYTRQLERKEIRDFIEKLKEKYGKVLKEIAKNESADFLDDYWETYSYMDAFIANRVNGEKFTMLTEKGVDLNNFEKYAREFLMLDYNGTNFPTHDVAIISMSHTIRSILNYMYAIKRGSSFNKNPKMVIYSAHDTTIAAFEVFNNKVFGSEIKYADFAESVFYELIKEGEEFKVRYYINDVEIFTKKLEDFSNDCLKNLMSDEEIAKICKWEEPKKIDIFMISTFVLIGIIGLLIIPLICMRISKNNEDIEEEDLREKKLENL